MPDCKEENIKESLVESKIITVASSQVLNSFTQLRSLKSDDKLLSINNEEKLE